MPGDKTEAELQLQRKYQLLKQKKLQQQQQQKAGSGQPGGSSKPAGGDAGPKVDPARLAAIEALKRKRAAEAAAKGGAPPEAAPSPAAAPEPSPKPTSGRKIKLGGGFKIPKRQTEHTTAQASVAAAKPPPAAPAAPTPTAEAPKPEGKAPLKRPALRRPVMARPSAAGGEPAAKRPQLDPQQQQAHGEAAAEQNSVPGFPGAPSIPQLWVGNLPPEWVSNDLYEFFVRFHDVKKARVVPEMCYGFVTFGSFEDAAAVLEFQQNQPVQAYDRELSIHWAMEGSGEGGSGGGGGGGGGGVSKFVAARAAAAQVAEQIDHYALAEVNLAGPPPSRDLVSYDDL